MQIRFFENALRLQAYSNKLYLSLVSLKTPPGASGMNKWACGRGALTGDFAACYDVNSR
jgi:hypothetical protein